MNIHVFGVNRERGSLILQLSNNGEPCPGSIIGIKQGSSTERATTNLRIEKANEEGKVEFFPDPTTTKLSFFFLDDPGSGWGAHLTIVPRFPNIINKVMEI